MGKSVKNITEMNEPELTPEERRDALIKKQGKHRLTRADLEELIAAWPGKDPTGQDFRDFLDARTNEM